jgi:SAM-dependent methyltransferase
MSDPELDRIHQSYERRKQSPGDRYTLARPEVLKSMQQVDRATIRALADVGLTNFPRLRILEVGCGAGGNLLQLVRWGADPANLVGNELLPDRLSMARRLLPAEVVLAPGDARELDLEPFDVVLQSTVLSSILDDEVQQGVADAMWRLTKPGGAVLSYDFTVDNPRNPDVRGVPVSRLRELFPHGRLRSRRVTLAPPLARRVARFGIVYSVLDAVPWLRTHAVVTVSKPR